MSRHLEEHELSATVAGMGLDPALREHLGLCLVCRQQARAMHDVIAGRRAALEAGEPDWEEQRRAILARLAVAPAGRRARPQVWWRPVLAAAVLAAVAAAAVLLRPQTAPQVPEKQVPVEQILAEVDATLDGAAIPGFGPLGSLVPGVENEDEVESLVAHGAS